MTPADLILSKLPDARRNGSGWSARCPAHDDKSPSLSIGVGDDGRVLLHCHAGCEAQAVVEAVGLTLADLMPQDGTGGNGRVVSAPVRVFPSAADAVRDYEKRHGRHAANWTYHNAAGEPVGLVVRWNRLNGKKDIRPVAKSATGWIQKQMPKPRPLYQLPTLATAARVYVCEGEPAADAVRSLGLVATTSTRGSGAAGDSDWHPLAGKNVVILPDRDGPGEKYAGDVVSLLARLNPRPTVRIIRLPDLPESGDAVDWVAARRAAGLSDDAMCDELEGMADAAEPVELPDVQSVNEGPVVLAMANMEARNVDWLWQGYIPLGRITLLVGRPGEGKSFFCMDAAARVSTGRHWPDGSPCPRGNVLLISGEDDPHDTLRPRLDAHQADIQRIGLLRNVRRLREDGTPHEVPFTLADVDMLELALQQIPDCKLLIIDPVGSFIGGRVDAHRDNEVRSVLAPVASLAEKYGPAVLAVAHRRKSGGTAADDLALGSRAFTGIARSTLHLSRDPNDKARRLLLPGKNNLADVGTGFAFTITGTPPAVCWEREPVNLNADEGLAAEVAGKPGPQPAVLNDAADWLRSALDDGPRLAKDLYEEGVDGKGFSRRTVQRAREAIGAEAFREVVPGPWSWRLPDHVSKDANKDAKEPRERHLGDLGILAENEGKQRKGIGSRENNAKNAKISLPGALPGVLGDAPPTVPDGWTADGWASRLRDMAGRCESGNAERAADLRQQAAALEGVA